VPWPTLTPTVAARPSNSSKRAAGTRRCFGPRDGNVLTSPGPRLTRRRFPRNRCRQDTGGALVQLLMCHRDAPGTLRRGQNGRSEHVEDRGRDRRDRGPGPARAWSTPAPLARGSTTCLRHCRLTRRPPTCSGSPHSRPAPASPTANASGSARSSPLHAGGLGPTWEPRQPVR
jgi:hypothetical protein